MKLKEGMATRKKTAGTRSVATPRRATAASRNPLYSAKFYKGDYIERQRQANTDKCVAYVEHHFNNSDSPNPNYAVVDRKSTRLNSSHQ